MSTVKQNRIANLESSHIIVNTQLTSVGQTLAQITTKLGLDPTKDDDHDLKYVERRLSILCDESLASRTPGDRIADPKFPNRPVAKYTLAP